MASPRSSPALDDAPCSPTAAGQPGSSQVCGDSSKNRPLGNEVAFFNHRAAHKALQGLREATARQYTAKNIEHSDALETRTAAAARHSRSREKRKHYRWVMVNAWLHVSEDQEQGIGGSNDEQWELETASNVSEPNSLFDENVMSAKEKHKSAKEAVTTIWEEMRAIRTQLNQYNRMIADLEKQYPELGGHHMGKHRGTKRKAESTSDEKNEAEAPPAKRAKSTIPDKHQKAVDDWHKTCTTVLKAHGELKEFPAPIAWDCASREICNRNHPDLNSPTARVLRACEHNIREACDHLTKRELKQYMTMFHPDKFSAVQQDDKRKAWQLMTNEVFVVLSEMFEKKDDDDETTRAGSTTTTTTQKKKKSTNCTCGFERGDPTATGCTCRFD
ncbi:hypothetical protein M409DRAFT_23893 [Zasmidium cellare ATCC 36951]|uniref:Uncharacterized protein n=1 Tax=Zasmidium cellare ATCC 36951 TaxID=1080233 RepID=A0A6A6CHF2_ZASCE|nr:uncharacterized protein M409DRAFT_23893 [Zasmidium cellare ATCC 36951]KAF2165600.1 hypothetical protein M409DRAFT_23893 [Zasmidium cellare ATCC 36951]